MQTHRNFSLDFIRSISILLIIYFHYNCEITRIISTNLTNSKYYLFAGNIGVSLFFILSGASLALSTKENYSIFNFYRKRFMAIFPIYWLTYVLVAIAKIIFFPHKHFTCTNPFAFILTIFGLDGFYLYKIPNYYLIGEWFLGCIIIIYILFPVVRWLFATNKHLTLLLFFLISIIIDLTYNLDMSLRRFPLFRIFEFTFGMYWITTFNNSQNKTNIILIPTSLLGIAFATSCAYCNNPFVSNIILGLFSFVLLISISNFFEKDIPKQIFNFLSKYSYAAFLLHHVTIIAILTFFKNGNFPTKHIYTTQLFALLVVFMFSTITYNTATPVLAAFTG